MGPDGPAVLPRAVGDDVSGRKALLATVAAAAAALLAAALLSGAFAGAPDQGHVSSTAVQLTQSRAAGAAQHRYWTTSTRGGLRASNPGQGLHTAFHRGAVSLSAGSGTVSLSLAGIGRGSRLRPAGAPTITARANQVTYRRRGLTEWYANGPLGVEQGFVVRTPPAGSATQPISLAYRISGAGRRSLAGGVLSVFSATGAPVLRYGGLTATDATGRRLATRLELDAGYLVIRIADAGARYPLHVDPLIQGASSGAADFGVRAAALALDNSTALTLSVTPLNGSGNAYGTADEGFGNPLLARITITNPSGGDTATAVPAVPVTVGPSSALTATGAPTPAIPAGGYTLNAGQSESFVVPYKISQSGQATISDSVTWHYQADTNQGTSSGQAAVALGVHLSGTAFGKTCTETSCQQKGLADQTVTAAGTATDGTVVIRNATTAADGAFSFGLPAGRFNVAPVGEGWAPKSVNETLTADLGGVNFVKCAMLETAAEASTEAGAAASSEPCTRPAKLTMFCEYRPKSFVSFTKITTQSCFVTVIDQGPLPHQTPTGSVKFRSVEIGRIVGVIDPNPCQLTPSISTGAAECSVTLDPGTYSKVGDALGVVGTYSDPTNTFKSATITYNSSYSPKLDPSNKVTAARIEAHLIAIKEASTDLGLASTPAIAVPGGAAVPAVFGATAFVAGAIGVPMHYLQLPDEPPDPKYAQVFRPHIPRSGVVRTASKAWSRALTALNRNDLAIDGWAGAEWNALNRSVVAQLKENRAAFVTQMSAASRDESELAVLVAKLPAEVRAVERLAPSKYRRLSVRVSASQLRQLKKALATPSRAEKRFYTSLGLAPSLVQSLTTGPARHLRRSTVNGNVFAKLKTAAAAEASIAGFLRRVAAVHAAMAQQYS